MGDLKLKRYKTMDLEEIKSLPVEMTHGSFTNRSHLYLWVPNALLKEGLEVIEGPLLKNNWSGSFKYKTNIVIKIK